MCKCYTFNVKIKVTICVILNPHSPKAETYFTCSFFLLNLRPNWDIHSVLSSLLYPSIFDYLITSPWHWEAQCCLSPRISNENFLPGYLMKIPPLLPTIASWIIAAPKMNITPSYGQYWPNISSTNKVWKRTHWSYLMWKFILWDNF